MKFGYLHRAQQYVARFTFAAALGIASLNPLSAEALPVNCVDYAVAVVEMNEAMLNYLGLEDMSDENEYNLFQNAYASCERGSF